MPVVGSVACDFEGARRGRKVRAPKAPRTCGSLGACSRSRKFFKLRVSEMPSAAFYAGHFQQIKTKENSVISCLFYSSISSIIGKV